jgi:hypothetical protein
MNGIVNRPNTFCLSLPSINVKAKFGIAARDCGENNKAECPHCRHHSYLSAISGSTFVARRAGMKQANNARTIKTTEEIPKVIRSLGATPNKRLLIERVTTIAPTTPIATPISVNFIP